MTPQVPHFNEYVEPTVELVLNLLAEAYKDQHKLDKVLKEISEEVFAELAKEIQKLADDGKINLDKKIDLYNNPAIFVALKQIEAKQLQRFVEFCWLGEQVLKDSLKRTYSTTIATTYQMFNYVKGLSPHIPSSGPKSYNILVQTIDTHFTDKVLNIPWHKDGKIYSQRLWKHVSQFQSKLCYVLEEGINKGRGLEWMMKAWRKLAGGTSYAIARLLKTETVAMWSRATKEAYMEMGIEYVVIVGDALCGTICVDYTNGEPIRLADAEAGGLLPPYHPNCACSFVAYTDVSNEPLGEIY